MEKEFSFVEMLKYCVKRWLIILIVAIVCCGGFSVYTFVFKKNTTAVICSGNATVASLNALYPEINNDITKEKYGNIISAYNQNLSRAINIMTTVGLKNKVYNMVRETYLNKKTIDENSEREFLLALNVVPTAISIDVSFVSRDKTAEQIAVAKKIVDVYLDEAINAVQIDNPIFKSSNAIVKSQLIESDAILAKDGKLLDKKNEPKSKLADVFIGLIGGIFLGGGITIILYFTDNRVKSYNDISYLTGNKLFGVVVDDNSVFVCPKIDAVIDEKKSKSVLFASCSPIDFALGANYASYCAGAGYKTLLIDFNAKNKDSKQSLRDVFNGDKIATIENGYSVVFASEGEWTSVLNNKAKLDVVKQAFERVVIVVDYTHSGSLAVLGQISESVVVVIDQNSSKIKIVNGLYNELNMQENLIGAVIFNPNDSYVGSIV